MLVGTKFIRTWTVAASLSALAGGCTSATANRPGYAKPSFTESITNSVKSGAGKVTAALTPKPSPPQEKSDFGPPKPSPGIHVAIAAMAERNGNLEEAEVHYRKALDIDANHLPAMLGYAHLEDGRKRYDEAMKLYQRAIKKHPKEAAAHNDLGLCYQHQGKLKEAAKSFETAVELQPARRLYRGNLAAVLLEQGKNDEALRQLIAANGEAIGYYNMAYLLAQRPDPRPSIPYFQKALERDSTLEPAREWLAQLTGPPPRPVAPPPTWVPPTQQQQPAMVARQTAPAPSAPPMQVESLPTVTAPPAQREVAAAPTVSPAVAPSEQPRRERQPALVAKTDRPAPAPAPVVQTVRPDGVIRATIGDGTSSGNSGSSSTSGEFQFVPTSR